MTTELDLHDYIRILRKRVGLIITIVAVATIAAAVISFYFMKPVYEASTKIIVNKSNENISASQIDINSVNLNIKLIDTYKEIIKTVAIMDKVATEYPQFGLTAEQLIGKIKVSSVNNTQVMTLSVQDESYTRAAEIVNAVSEVFQTEIQEIMTVDNVSILSKAKPLADPSPVKPNPKLNIAISFVLSLMAAVGIVILLEYLDDTIKTEKDVQEYLGLPTLATIMKIKSTDLQHESKNAKSKVQVGEQTHASTVNR